MNSVEAYVALWSEPDPARWPDLLARCWTETSEIIGPGYRFRGVQAVLDELARWRREQPGWRAVQTSGFDRHGDWVRFTIAVHDAGGVPRSEGWDVVELAPDGRIERVVTFWGPLPPAPAT